MFGNELKRLARVLLQPSAIPDRQFVRRPMHEIARFFGDSVSTRSCYYVAAWDDLAPLLADMMNVLARR